jgi:4-hydroxy-3-methylbut-2-en-1-yl diphosphate reductase
VDVILVIGGRNSSNSNRLREVALQYSVPAFLIEDASQIDPDWVRGATHVGVTSGASTPEYLVTEVRERLRDLGASSEHQLTGVRETVTFRMPSMLMPTGS